jgi:hypothetical protein
MGGFLFSYFKLFVFSDKKLAIIAQHCYASVCFFIKVYGFNEIEENLHRGKMIEYIGGDYAEIL